MDSLPIETTFHIVSFLPRKDLKHLSLVSTRFAPPAQQALFKRVQILNWNSRIRSGNFLDFVDVVIKWRHIGVWIKRLTIGPMFREGLHYRPLVQLLELVHDLRELLWYSPKLPASISFRPHQLSQLRLLQWPLSGTKIDIFHTLLPYSSITDLYLLDDPNRLETKATFASLLEPSSSGWINKLVRYTGSSYLIEGLSEDASLLHFCSENPLSEGTLRGIANKRLLSLHVHVPWYRQTSIEDLHILPSPLPSLFPNLQSVAWFNVQLRSASWDAFQDPVNEPLIACLQQLRDLRLVAFAIGSLPDNRDDPLCRFISDFQDFVQKHGLRLESFWTRVVPRDCLRKYTREKSDMLTWIIETRNWDVPEFVDRW